MTACLPGCRDTAVAARAVTEDSLHDTLTIALSQLYGLIGGAIVFFVEKSPASAPEFDILVDRRLATLLYFPVYTFLLSPACLCVFAKH